MQCVSNACALVVTAAKLILHCITGLRFRHRASIYRCRDYLPEVVSAPLKFWAPVSKFFQDRYVYTAITDSAVPKNCQYGANILGCRANFLVRVNGVLEKLIKLLPNSWQNAEIERELAIWNIVKFHIENSLSTLVLKERCEKK